MKFKKTIIQIIFIFLLIAGLFIIDESSYLTLILTAQKSLNNSPINSMDFLFHLGNYLSVLCTGIIVSLIGIIGSMINFYFWLKNSSKK